MSREGNRLIVELPEGLDVALTPDGTYRLEAEWAGMAKLKLVERPPSTVYVRDKDVGNKPNEADEVAEVTSIDDGTV